MSSRRVLLVEGSDDEHVLKHICGTRGIPHLDLVQPHGGVDPLLESIPVRLKASEDGDIFGVIVDADSDLPGRWESLRSRLIRIGYAPVPDRPQATGTIIEPPMGTLLPRVGVWVMPNNQTTGILEDFLRFLIPQDSPLLVHVKESVDAIPQTQRRFNSASTPKAVIHTWLAWQEEPGKPLGTAITARYLDPAVPQVDILVAWLRLLFFPIT